VKLITDNILVAYEALHTMDAWMKGRGRYMALKIDTSKMRFFAKRWIQLLVTCIKICVYLVVINGKLIVKSFQLEESGKGIPITLFIYYV